MAPPSPADRRARRSPEEARAHILDAAEEALARLGPDAAGLKEVAAAAGVSHALVTHYFGRYEALVEAVVERALARTRARVTETMEAALRRRSPAQVVDAIFEGFRAGNTARLVSWALLRAPSERHEASPRRVQGLKAMADVVERLFAAPRETIEFAVMTAAAAGLGYVVGGAAYEEALGHAPSREREERYARFLGDLLHARLERPEREDGGSAQAIRLPPRDDEAIAAVDREVIERLLRAASSARDLDVPLRIVAEWLDAEGLAPGRANLAIVTHHPSLAGIGYAWTRAVRDVAKHERPWGFLDSAEHLASPLHVVMTTRAPLRLRLSQGEGLDRFAIARDFLAAGATDYLALPLPSSRGDVHVFSVWTDRAGGFTAKDVVRIASVAVPLATIVDLFESRRLARTIVETYLGPRTGPRVLEGKMQRGASERLKAAVWFSDVRSFTDATERYGDEAMVGALDRWFELAISAVHAHGGEVLKLMGDAVLAVFPVAGGDWQQATESALTAGVALHEAEEAHALHSNLPLRSVIALHAGEVLYGNVGSARRLDFTVIGTTVNAAARLSGLCRTLGEPILVSDAFAARNARAFAPLGKQSLRGLRDPMGVFAPRAPTESRPTSRRRDDA